MKALAASDPGRVTRDSLIQFLVPLIHTYLDPTEYGYEGYMGNAIGSRDLANAMINRVARESGASHYEVTGPISHGSALLTPEISPLETVELVIPGACETGEHGTSLSPVLDLVGSAGRVPSATRRTQKGGGITRVDPMRFITTVFIVESRSTTMRSPKRPERCSKSRTPYLKPARKWGNLL